MSKSGTAFLAAALLPLAAYAGETMTVHYVEVPVSVVARDGSPVRKLMKANFELYDGRKRVEINSFETIDFGSPASLRANAGNPAAHRSFLILFDLSYSSPSSLARAQSAARTFVQKNVLAGDLVGVGTIDTQRGFRLLANFTSDRAAVAGAIDRPASYRGPDPLQLAATSATPKIDADRDLILQQDSASSAARAFEQSEARQDMARMARDAEEQFLRERVHRQLDLLAQVAAAMRSLGGRTQVVFLSEGFSARLISGRSARDVNEENDDAYWAMGGQMFKVDSDRRYGNSGSQIVLEKMAQAFRASGVVLNAIDLRGLRPDADLARGEMDDNSDSLSLLARPTGGEVLRNSNDIAGSLARMLQHQEVVYVLGFQAPVATPGKLHDLDVKLVGVPHATASFRRAYVEGGVTATALEKTLAAADIIVRDLPQGDIRLAALATAFPSNGEKAQVPVVVEISGPDLVKAAKAKNVTAEVFMYAFDEEGTVRDRVYQRLSIDPVKAGAKFQENGLKYIVTLQLPPGKYAVKTLVRTPETERNGYVRSDVVVPKSGETVLLHPFVLDDPNAWVIVRGAQHGDAAAYPFHINGQPFVPSASGRVPVGAVRKVAVFVCNADPEELTWKTAPRATLLAQMKSVAATKLVLQLDERGPATFDLTIQKKGSPEVRRESVPLGVE